MSEMPSPGSLLLDALYRGDREAVEAQLAEATDLTIFEAAAVGNAGRVHQLLLLEPGFVDQWSPDGFTALQLAAFFGHEEVAAELLRRGADVHAVARNPLRVQALHSAAAGGHTEVARLLLEHGADPNARQEGGFAPIHSAAQSGNEELYDLLLASGADQDAAAEDGRTAADFRAAP
ncbi:MAG TPA: ankyrin repeat domain-containing protein [Gaiellaceae bacterium]